MEDTLTWLDTETGDLNPANAPLLEVACLITDRQYNLLEPEGYHSVIYYPETEVQKIYDKAPEIVQKMHTETNLWERLTTEGKPLEIVEHELLKYIETTTGTIKPRSTRLAGNSVRLDFNFLDYYMPELAKVLHYRVLDVSTLRFDIESDYPEFTHDKPTPHHALKDIILSLEEAKAIRAYRKMKNTPSIYSVVKD